jgi:hypothetical protein
MLVHVRYDAFTSYNILHQKPEGQFWTMIFV